MRIADIHKNYSTLLESDVDVCGWVLTCRAQAKDCFIKLSDGSHPDGIQIITPATDTKYIAGTSLKVRGTLVASPAEGQLFEVQACLIEVLGTCDASYALSKTKMSLDYLRGFAHLRARTSTFGSVFRIKSAISQATHAFFAGKGYYHLDPNIMTINECEGGAGVFQVTEHDISKLDKLARIHKTEVGGDGKPVKVPTEAYDWSKDHFGKPVFLTVSSQLQLEALACALGSVYTTNKSFRSEHSSTAKHLSEFTHLEIEACFIGLDELMSVGEEFIKFVGSELLRSCADDIRNLDKFVSKGLAERIHKIVGGKFHRIKYAEAVETAQSLGKSIKYGEDLSSEVERALTDYYNGPVFVSHWPLAIKSFYMKQDPVDSSICHNFDLLMPYGVGEMIGGSMREDNYEKLMAAMAAKGVSAEPLKFYTDLRLYGSVPHGGFGLGFDRMTMLFTGMENIRDCVPFPVAFKTCDY